MVCHCIFSLLGGGCGAVQLRTFWQLNLLIAIYLLCRHTWQHYAEAVCSDWHNFSLWHSIWMIQITSNRIDLVLHLWLVDSRGTLQSLPAWQSHTWQIYKETVFL